MTKTQTFRAIRTQSGKWAIRITEFSFYVSHDLPQLCSEISDEQRINAEKCLGMNCSIVEVALVDPRYLESLERFHMLMQHEAFLADAEAHLVSMHIDRLRAEGET